MLVDGATVKRYQLGRRFDLCVGTSGEIGEWASRAQQRLEFVSKESSQVHKRIRVMQPTGLGFVHGSVRVRLGSGCEVVAALFFCALAEVSFVLVAAVAALVALQAECGFGTLAGLAWALHGGGHDPVIKESWKL
jgi:hypothetical protein